MNEQCFQKSYSQDVPRYDFQLAKYGSVHNSHELFRVGDEILPVCKMYGHRQVPACSATHRYAFFLLTIYTGVLLEMLYDCRLPNHRLNPH